MFAKAFRLCDDTRKEAVAVIEQTSSDIVNFEAQWTFNGETVLGYSCVSRRRYSLRAASLSAATLFLV